MTIPLRDITTQFTWLAACVLALAPAALAPGHGTPIRVDVVAGKLVVSGGWADSSGFAPMIFGEDDEDGEPFATLSLPGLGPVVLWLLPGLEIVGMNDASSLSIEVVSPPSNGGAGHDRLLWYREPLPSPVSQAPAAFHLLGTGQRSLLIPPAADAPPPAFNLADSIGGQQGFHNHNLLRYALDNDPAAPAGVYGFFARLTASLHAPSDPFLLVFNRDVNFDQVMPAALAINSVAGATLPGDYNRNGIVDAADFVVWRDTLGSNSALAADGSGNQLIDADDLTIWRSNFGRSVSTAAAMLGSHETQNAVPEPAGVILAALSAACIACGRSFRRRAIGTNFSNFN